MSLIEKINIRFNSGNTVHVERATITREEWESIKGLIRMQHEALDKIIGLGLRLGPDWDEARAALAKYNDVMGEKQ